MRDLNLRQSRIESELMVASARNERAIQENRERIRRIAEKVQAEVIRNDQIEDVIGK